MCADVEAIGETISNFRIHRTSPATRRIDLTFDWCKVVLRRRARNARRRCTPILSATFDTRSIDSRRGEGSEIVTWITIETLLTWVYLVPDRKPWVCLPISFPFEARRVYRRKKNREWNAARKEWKLNGEVDTRGSSSLFLHFVENRSDIRHRRITAALLDEFQGRRKTAAIAPWKKMIHPGKIQACTFSRRGND